ncbi:pentapeptide repeat-containing protein [Methylobacillus flagellatus]|uniref:pentapeptide repeat-containing protein n=1 Tax=Methylobacillus flagellatus TaxID=405 RepID=UPI0010F616EF|nr:pentapeptide repeat-containing protein [Methylobacillus flagellatus]
MKLIKTLLLALLLMASQAYAGEFGNHCTTGLSMERVHQTDCSVNTVFEGKTYCFGNQEAQATFQKDPKAIIAKAQAFYATLPEPEREKLTQAQADALIASKQCDLSNKELGYLQFDKADLRHCTMVNTSFFGAYLRGADLSGANMQRAYLNLARLEGTNLSGADLTDAIIFQAIFDKTNFRGANLSNARMIGTLGAVDISAATVKNGRFGLDVGNQPMGQMKFDSVGGKFANTNFEGADLNIAAFRFADLRGANLRNTNLYRADLIRADLTGADLTGADLRDAEVDGAIFKDVKGLDTVKHLDTVKGQCKDCMASVAEAAEPVHAATAKQAQLCLQQQLSK